MESQAKKPSHFRYIDTLRGLAFLGVLVVHCVAQVGPFPDHDLLSTGYPVQLFFLVSAITLCYSMSSRTKMDRLPWLSFFVRRFFRIAPLFWMAIVFYSLCPDFLNPTDSHIPIQPYEYLLTFLFLHGFSLEALNRVVPGGWSVTVEWTFYLFFPLLFSAITSLKKAIVGILISALVASLGLMPIISSLRKIAPGNEYNQLSMFSHACFASQGPVFLIGFATYFFLRSGPEFLTKSRFWSCILLFFSAIVYVILLSVKHSVLPVLYPEVIFLALMIIAISGESVPYIVNPVLCYLGKISFSCYLVHFAVLGLTLHILGFASNMLAKDPGSGGHNFLLFLKILAITLGFTVAGSTITHYLIEEPGIGLGRKIVQRLNRYERSDHRS
jgi:peptidoglycan/LPS O-acetylase OafA/YrhL